MLGYITAALPAKNAETTQAFDYHSLPCLLFSVRRLPSLFSPFRVLAPETLLPRIHFFSSLPCYSLTETPAAMLRNIFLGASVVAPLVVAAPAEKVYGRTILGRSNSSCTFTDADAAKDGKSSCSSIILKDITVPAGTTLDLTDLADGTHVTFEGTTSFEYDEWEGPLISFSGKNILIDGASGHVIDGNGAQWWDGEGSNGGVTKPK
jgi:hypothetical protein